MKNGKYEVRSPYHNNTPSKTCTTSARSESLWISVIENDSATGVLGERAVCDNKAGVVAKGTEVVQAVTRGVPKPAAKRTIVLKTSVLRVPRGALTAVGAFVFQAVNTKMPHDVAVKTMSLISHCGFWAQMGVSRCNSSGIRGSTTLMECRTRVNGGI